MNTYEKKYKEALENARQEYNITENVERKQWLEELFPELKESEDEKIRKELLEHCKNQAKPYIQTGNKCPQIQSWIAWLEKQGEQKPADKVEPKFHEGDWVVDKNGIVKQILYYKDGIYKHTNGYSAEIFEYEWRLWTIQDAKDGDVLYHSDTASNGIFIFKELFEYEFGKKVICYCDYDSEDGFCLGESHTCCWADAKILHPATKEQRNLLFQKIREAGYEWDADKKELKKIEQQFVNNEYTFKSIPRLLEMIEPTNRAKAYCQKLIDSLQKEGYSIDAKIVGDCLKQMNGEKVAMAVMDNVMNKQKPAWSEEDEKIYQSIIDDTVQENQLDDKQIIWLKSIKDRIQHQPKQQWSEEDEEFLRRAINATKDAYPMTADWLKSLKERL